MSSVSEIIYHTSCRELQHQHFPAWLIVAIKLSVAGWDIFCMLINHSSPLLDIKEKKSLGKNK